MNRVVVAISSFKSDAAALALLDRIESQRWPVEAVFVVDSLGEGGLESAVASRAWRRPVHYENHPENLGSAGNLRRRLELAVDAGADWVLTLNHDADLHLDAVQTLIRAADRPNAGALYPLKYLPGRGYYTLAGRYARSGALAFPFRDHGLAEPPDEPLIAVSWGSSNGALYATAPLRERGIGPDAALWLGWEDYLLGLHLHDAGYDQFIVTAAVTEDDYEIRSERLAGRTVHVSDKPAWYLYYGVRNMLLSNLHLAPSPTRAAKSLAWTVAMASHVWIRRDARRPLFALRAYLAGVRDGLLGRSGKWTHP